MNTICQPVRPEIDYAKRYALLVIGLTQCVPQGECLTLAVGRGPGPRSSPIATRLSFGIDRSPLMVKAARERVARLPNVEIFEGDGRKSLPEGPFDMIFLGGLCMYLKNADVLTLLHSLKHRLTKEGSIILRESRSGPRQPRVNRVVKLTIAKARAHYSTTA